LDFLSVLTGRALRQGSFKRTLHNYSIHANEDEAAFVASRGGVRAGDDVHVVTVAGAIVLRGVSLADFWLNIVVLAGMGRGICSLCALQFTRKIA
jgi:hypothetical protein